jgi:hypothetical protein
VAREVVRAAKEAAAKAREEAKAERMAREDAERKMLAERKAREEAERRAKEEADRRTEAEARAARDAERHAEESARRSKKAGPKSAGAKSNGRKSAAAKPAIRKPAGPKPRHNDAGKTKGKARPTLDEWGLYDPAKCGFGALYAKLEEIEENESSDEGDEGRGPAGIDAPAMPSAARNPRPLSMWAWRTAAEPERVAPRRPTVLPPDDFRGLVARLKIPAAIAAVRYASGARIRRVRVSPAAPDAGHDPSQVIILSRKLLNAVREQPEGARRSPAA